MRKIAELFEQLDVVSIPGKDAPYNEVRDFVKSRFFIKGNVTEFMQLRSCTSGINGLFNYGIDNYELKDGSVLITSNKVVLGESFAKAALMIIRGQDKFPGLTKHAKYWYFTDDPINDDPNDVYAEDDTLEHISF